LGAVGEGGDRLRAADGVDLVRARRLQRRERRGMGQRAAAHRRYGGADARHSRRLRRYHEHKRRGKERVIAAGNVAAAGIDRYHRMAEKDALFYFDFAERPEGIPLQFREFPDVCRRALDRGAQFRRCFVIGAVELALRHKEGGGRLPAEFYVVVGYRRVAFGAHVFDDLFHRREYARVLREICCFGFFIVSHIDHSVVIQLLC